MENTDFRSMFPKLTDYEVKYYLFELLKVIIIFKINFRHSIMHMQEEYFIAMSNHKIL